MMFCKKVVPRGCSGAAKWHQRESRFFEEGAVMAGRFSAVREVKGLPVGYSLLLLQSRRRVFELTEPISSPTLKDDELSALAAAAENGKEIVSS